MKITPYLASMLTVLILACDPASDQPPPSTDSTTVQDLEPGAAAENNVLVMTTMLRDSSVIEEYEHYHSKSGVFPEIEEANIDSDTRLVAIYRQGLRLVMILETPPDWDQEKADSLYAASSPRVAEWGKIMGAMQAPPPGADSGQVWVPMKLVHHYRHDIGFERSPE